MHVFLTGATGFVGHHLVHALLEAGHTVRCLVREDSLDKLPVEAGSYEIVDSSKEAIVAGEAPATGTPGRPVEVVFGDIFSVESIEGDMAGCDVVIHLVGIIEENRPKNITFENVHVRGTRTVVEQARAAEVPRFILMSANGARSDNDPSRYQYTKWQAEEIVRGAGFDSAVIFKPSIIFGDPGDDRPEFATRLAETLVRPFPVLPVLGDGQYKLQPVHIEDVTRAFTKAVDMDIESGSVREYCLAGPTVVTFDETLDIIANATGGKPKPKAHMPLSISRMLVGTAGAVGLLPISPAQFQMLIEGNTCETDDFAEDFSPQMISFSVENLSYLSDSGK